MAINLNKIRDLVGENKFEDAIEQLRILVGHLDTELFNTASVLKGSLTDWNRRRMGGGNAPDEAKNEIGMSILALAGRAEEVLSKRVENIKESAREGDYHSAIDIIDQIIVIVENEDLRTLRLKYSERLLEKTPSITPRIETFSFFWTFVIVTALTGLPPIFLYFSFYFRKSSSFDWFYIINLILQISLLACMVLYKLKPQVVVAEFIKNAPKNIRSKFENNVNDLKWFSERANVAISQFGVWWRYLGFSYIALYVLYYFHWILGVCYDKFPKSVYPKLHVLYDKVDDFADVIINGSEGFFLFILYRIVTENTIKPSPSQDTVFEQDLHYQRELGIAVTLLFVFVVTSLAFINTPEIYQYYGLFSLISRTISGTVVAIGLCLVIGRLDSKFIEPKEWVLVVLYSYAAIQLLFTLFDPTLIQDVVRQIKRISPTEALPPEDLDAIELYVGNIKMTVLYFILILKGYFIYFIIKIHRNNELFHYFLLGSKLNDEIAMRKEADSIHKTFS